MAFVVTAIEKGKAYRVTISKPLTEDKAKAFKKDMEAQNKIAIPKYRIFSDLKVEKKK